MLRQSARYEWTVSDWRPVSLRSTRPAVAGRGATTKSGPASRRSDSADSKAWPSRPNTAPAVSAPTAVRDIYEEPPPDLVELIMAVAEGKLDSVDDIAAVLATATEPRR